MAVGSKGTFATVNPNQGVIDVGGMARRESARQSQIQEKKNLLEGRFQVKTREIGEALSKPEPKETGYLTYDQINFKAASLLREEQYKVLQKIGGSRLGEGMSLPEMRAEASKYESKFNNYADKMSMMKPAINNFMDVIANDNLSRAIGGDFTGEDGIGTKILNGDIEDVILDKDGEPLLIVNGKRMAVDRLHNFFSSPILKRDLTDDANTTADELIVRTTEAVGAINDNLKYYQTRLEEGMTEDQEDEVREKGEAIAKDPKFVGDLWFQYTQSELGEGQSGIYTPDDLTDTQLEDLAQWSGNEMVKLVNNRVKKSLRDSFNYTEQGKAIVRAAKASKEAEEGRIEITPPSPANIGQYPNGLRAINEYNKEQGIQQTVTDAQFAGAQEISITSGNAKFENLQLSDDTGNLRDFNNVTLEGITRLPNGTYLARGYRLVSEGGTITQTDEQRRRSFEALERIPKDQLEVYNSDETSDLVKKNLFETWKTKYDITEPQLRQAVKTTDKYESFSAVIPEPQQVLPRVGISEEDFVTQESVEQSTKPTFN